MKKVSIVLSVLFATTAFAADAPDDWKLSDLKGATIEYTGPAVTIPVGTDQIRFTSSQSSPLFNEGAESGECQLNIGTNIGTNFLTPTVQPLVLSTGRQFILGAEDPALSAMRPPYDAFTLPGDRSFGALLCTPSGNAPMTVADLKKAFGGQIKITLPPSDEASVLRSGSAPASRSISTHRVSVD